MLNYCNSNRYNRRSNSDTLLGYANNPCSRPTITIFVPIGNVTEIGRKQTWQAKKLTKKKPTVKKDDKQPPNRWGLVTLKRVSCNGRWLLLGNASFKRCSFQRYPQRYNESNPLCQWMDSIYSISSSHDKKQMPHAFCVEQPMKRSATNQCWRLTERANAPFHFYLSPRAALPFELFLHYISYLFKLLSIIFFMLSFF